MAENSNSNEALREALDGVTGILEEILDAFERGTGGVLKSDIREAIKTARAALALPRRQCDVGTFGEQYNRYAEFCEQHYREYSVGKCEKCPFAEPTCKFAWAQLPYDKQPNNGNNEEQSK